MFTIFATKKLLDRVKPSVTVPGTVPGALFGDWYATALFCKPQVALLVNEKTLLPVLISLAPVADLEARFPKHL